MSVHVEYSDADHVRLGLQFGPDEDDSILNLEPGQVGWVVGLVSDTVHCVYGTPSEMRSFFERLRTDATDCLQRMDGLIECHACAGTGLNDDSHAGVVCETCSGSGLIK